MRTGLAVLAHRIFICSCFPRYFHVTLIFVCIVHISLLSFVVYSIFAFGYTTVHVKRRHCGQMGEWPGYGRGKIWALDLRPMVCGSDTSPVTVFLLFFRTHTLLPALGAASLRATGLCRQNFLQSMSLRFYPTPFLL
jgi:hypothetical protein